MVGAVAPGWLCVPWGSLGSVLEPLLINTFANGLEEENKCKFAGDTKLGRGAVKGQNCLSETSRKEISRRRPPGRKNGPTRISGNSSRANARSCTLDRFISCNSRDWGPAGCGGVGRYQPGLNRRFKVGHV